MTYDAHDVSPDMSFLEMLDVLNERLIAKGEEPIAFDHDCREGICGTCGMMINGLAHGPQPRDHRLPAAHAARSRTATRSTIEPWRAQAFPVIKDLVVDRGAFDRIIAAGGFVSVQHRQRARRQRDPGAEGRRRPGDGRGRVHRLRRVRRRLPERLGDAVHRRPRSRTSALLPQGQPERDARVLEHGRGAWTTEGFGACTNHYECEAACPKEIRAASSSRA